MKIRVTVNDTTTTYLCKDWSWVDDMLMIHTKPTRLLIGNKETNYTAPAKTVYINRSSIDSMEIEEDA